VSPPPPPQPPLSRDRVLDAAIRVADRGGVATITMRRVAQELGVEAMSLYHHVPNKDAILDGVVDRAHEVEDVAGGILEHLPTDELPYLTEMIVDHALQPGYDHTSEFRYGLDLILDALEARRGQSSRYRHVELIFHHGSGREVEVLLG
jgi:AcrR family transcriptional regulator